MNRRITQVGALVASAVIAFGLVAGCASKHGATPGAPVQSSASVATASLGGASVTLHVGERVDVVLPAGPASASGETTNYAVTPKGSNVLTPVAGSAGSFVGSVPGTAKVVVTQTPVCEPGKECPAHIIELGTVMVTVTG